jgi:hypothetical protein
MICRQWTGGCRERATINALIEKIDIRAWYFNLLERRVPPDGKRMSINVGLIAVA